MNLMNPEKKSILILVLSIVEIIFSITLITGCIPDPPAAPDWNVKLTIPVLNEKYYIMDELDDEEGFYVDTLSINGNKIEVVGFSIDSTIEPVFISDYATIEDQESDPELFHSNDFDIDISPSTLFVDIPLSMIWPDSRLFQGDTVPIPPIPETILPELSAGTYDDYHWLDIHKGGFTVESTNNLPITLDKLDATVSDSNDNCFPIYHLGPVDSRENSTKHNDLVNNYIENSLFLGLTVSSNEGSNGIPIPVDTASTITFGMYYDHIISLNGAELKASRFTDTLDVTTSFSTDSIIVDEATFASGKLDVHIDNELDFPIEARIIVPEFTRYGSALAENATLNPGPDGLLTFIMDDVKFTPSSPQTNPDSIKINPLAIISADIPDSTFITIETDDVISIINNITGTSIESFKGCICSSVELDTTNSSTGMSDDLPEFTIPHLTLSLSAFNSSAFAPEIRLQLSGFDSNGDLLSTVQIPEISIPEGAVDESVLNLEDYEPILDLINSRPDTISFSGIILPGYGAMESDDSISFKTCIKVPLVLAFEADTLENEEADEVTLDGDSRNTVHDNINNIHLFFSAESHLPVGAEMVFFFGFTPDLNELMQSPALRIPSSPDSTLAVSRAVLDADGIVSEPIESTWEIELDQNAIDILCHAPLYMAERIIIEGTNGDTIVVKPDDYIGISSYIQVITNTPFDD